MKVQIKKLVPEAIIPEYRLIGDAGLDLTATSVSKTDMYIEYGTGLAIAIPEGYVGLIYPRSSLSNYDLILSNHVGVIDSNYTGEIKFRFKTTKESEFVGRYPMVEINKPVIYNIGDRIGQIIIHKIPAIEFEEVPELDETNRGSNGYGSSGK